MWPFLSGLFEEGDEAAAIELVICAEVAELDQGGVNVHERGDAIAGFSGALAIDGFDYERAAGDVVPEGEFSPMFLFSELPTVVGPEEDDGVFGVGAFF